MPLANVASLLPPRTPALLVQHAARALRAGEAATVVTEGAPPCRILAAETAEEVPPGAVLLLTGQRLAGLTGEGAERPV